MLEISTFDIPGLKLVTPKRWFDERGAFSEIYSAKAFAEAGIASSFVQDNQSWSRMRGTIRGLHFQTPPHAQAKLVRVVRGRVLDVAVDMRKGSAHFGKHVAIGLGAEKGEQFFIPEGFAHGFCTLEPDTEVLYKVTAFYAPESDAGILWNDGALGIEWPSFAGASVSAKDAELPPLAKLKSPFSFAERPV